MFLIWLLGAYSAIILYCDLRVFCYKPTLHSVCGLDMLLYFMLFYIVLSTNHMEHSLLKLESAIIFFGFLMHLFTYSCLIFGRWLHFIWMYFYLSYWLSCYELCAIWGKTKWVNEFPTEGLYHNIMINYSHIVIHSCITGKLDSEYYSDWMLFKEWKYKVLLWHVVPKLGANFNVCWIDIFAIYYSWHLLQQLVWFYGG